jgi:hypothetical protein
MKCFKRFVLPLAVLTAMLLGLPALGVYLAGYSLDHYFEFPPNTRYVSHAPFSWPAFAIFALSILAVVLPLIVKGVKAYKKYPKGAARAPLYRFPWWGWLGAATGILAWILAWSRFAWFARFQAHTFSSLWLSYIVVINALCIRYRGHSLMTDRTGFFLLLFPLSAAFWWFFEYLNRFVQNWYYVGTDFSAWAYFWYATLAFMTVLPAVLSTRELLLSVAWIKAAFGRFHPVRWSGFKPISVAALLMAVVGLAGIGVWPNYLFPLLWLSPLLIIICLQALTKRPHILLEMAEGNWSGAVAASLAALLCGGFWEMWNYFSLAKWEYSVPLVHRFQIFEMPLLGYAGYLPFGLECVAIGTLLQPLPEKAPGSRPNRQKLSKTF